MTIRDFNALLQAHFLIRDVDIPGLSPSQTGISAAYFNALQNARTVYSKSIRFFIPFFAKQRYGLSRTYFMAGGIPVYFYDLKTRKRDTAPPPASCYRIHLTTPDPEGEAI